MKNLFSSLKSRLLGGGATSLQFTREITQRGGELLTNCNFDSLYKNDLQGGDLYLSTVTSAENLIGGRGASYPNLIFGVQPYVQMKEVQDYNCLVTSNNVFIQASQLGGVL